jgi:hypothetical protein
VGWFDQNAPAQGGWFSKNAPGGAAPGMHAPPLPPELQPDQPNTFLTSPHGLVREGLRQAVGGIEHMAQPGWDPKFGGAADVFEGLGQSASPAILPFLAANPLATFGALAAGVGTQTLAPPIAESLGASPEASRLIGDVGGLAAGGAVGRLGEAPLRGAVKGAVNQVQEDLPSINKWGRFGAGVGAFLGGRGVGGIQGAFNEGGAGYAAGAGVRGAASAAKGAVKGYRGVTSPEPIPEPPTEAKPASKAATTADPVAADRQEVIKSLGYGKTPYEQLDPAKQAAVDRITAMGNVQRNLRGEPPIIPAPPGTTIPEDIPERYHAHFNQLGGEVGTREAMAKDLDISKYLLKEKITPKEWEGKPLSEKIQLMKEANPKYKYASGSRSRQEADFTKHVADTLRDLYSK